MEKRRYISGCVSGICLAALLTGCETVQTIAKEAELTAGCQITWTGLGCNVGVGDKEVAEKSIGVASDATEENDG